jgi:adenylosuccinate lyase
MGECENIVLSKYSRESMRELFSERNIILNWRKCWVALAKAEHELGLKQITKEMISELKTNLDNIDFKAAREKEKECEHDVMSHIYAYSLVCPKAKGIIHLGATSQFVKCNTDLMLQHKALTIIREDLITLLFEFSKRIDETKNIATLSYTHYQPAQPTTIGRRLCNYAEELLMDLKDLDLLFKDYPLLGAKGATGTQASFLKLFGSEEKVKKLDTLIVKKLGFQTSYAVSTQTYPRKFDTKIACLLASICSSCKRFATDIRLLSNLGILEEPTKKNQTGSSAMPYKRNPMMSERISSLSRKVMNNVADFYEVYSEQWLERTLDDSASRRIDIPENFMLTDYILANTEKIISGFTVFEKRATKLLEEELPFMATENILMECVKRGNDRQKVHEIIKKHSFDVIKAIKQEGTKNDLLDRLSKEEIIGMKKNELEAIANIKEFIGLAVEQTNDFCKKELLIAIKKKDLNKNNKIL